MLTRPADQEDDTEHVAEALGRFVADADEHWGTLDRLAVIHTTEVGEGRSRPKGRSGGLTPITWPGWVDPANPHRARRILSDVESGLLRPCALGHSPRHTAIIALGERGASVGELPDICAT